MEICRCVWGFGRCLAFVCAITLITVLNMCASVYQCKRLFEEGTSNLLSHRSIMTSQDLLAFTQQSPQDIYTLGK